jgi:hypothetical protein
VYEVKRHVLEIHVFDNGPAGVGFPLFWLCGVCWDKRLGRFKTLEQRLVNHKIDLKTLQKPADAAAAGNVAATQT